MKNGVCFFVVIIMLISCSKTENDKDSSMYYPSAFTPYDYYNNHWRPYGVNILADGYMMRIYNKHNQLLFKSADINWGWDGKFNNEICAIDHYYYVVKYKNINKKMFTDRGVIQLIR